MVQITQYMMRNPPTSSNPLPLLNTLFIENFSAGFGNLNDQAAFKQFVKRAKKSPQLMGFISIIISDIISDEIKFEPTDYRDRGRNKILKAKKFWDANNGLGVLEETLADMLLLGIGYNWVGTLDDDQRKELKELCYDKAMSLCEYKEDAEFKAQQIYEVMVDAISENFVKKLRHIAASTVSIDNNSTEIIRFIQRVGVNQKIFQTDEVIQFRLMPFDGGVYPFCPMEALLAEVYLLWLITQNYASFFENGGHPDKVFTLPKEIAGSKNHQFLIDTLQKYKKIQNKHGNLVFTGELKIEDLMQIEKDMQHQDLGLYLTGVLALYYKVPAGRIPFLIGKAANNGDAGGLADSGYWRNISVWQSKIEYAYNTGLFNKYFGVNIKFGRGYKQDEVREVDIQVKKVQVAIQAVANGLWTSAYAAKYLDVPEEVFLEAQEEKKRRDAEILAQQTQLHDLKSGDPKVMYEPDKQLKNDVKRNTQNNNQAKAGGKKVNP